MATPVPLDALFENLEAGLSLDEFLEEFEGITREQAVAVLEYARRSVGGAGTRMKRVLLDHCVPRRIRQALVDCLTTTAFERGWAAFQNGAQTSIPYGPFLRRLMNSMAACPRRLSFVK